MFTFGAVTSSPSASFNCAVSIAVSLLLAKRNGLSSVNAMVVGAAQNLIVSESGVKLLP